jgi:hypothetical protein
VLDDFERFWPANLVFWLVVGLSLRLAERQPARGAQQAIGRIALANESGRPRPQRLVPLLRPSAPRQQLDTRMRDSQPNQLAARFQTGQIPFQQDRVRSATRNLVDQTLGRGADTHD